MESIRFLKARRNHKRAATKHNSHATTTSSPVAAAVLATAASSVVPSATVTSAVAAGTGVVPGAAYTGKATVVGTAPPISGKTANPSAGSDYLVSFAGTMTSYVPSLSSGAAPKASAAASGSTEAQSSSSSKSGFALSSTAKYAIIAGAGGLALIIACIGVWCCCKNRKKKKQKQNEWFKIADDGKGGLNGRQLQVLPTQSWSPNEKGWGERRYEPEAHDLPILSRKDLDQVRDQSRNPFIDEKSPIRRELDDVDLRPPAAAYADYAGHVRRETEPGSVNGVIAFQGWRDSAATSAYPASPGRSAHFSNRQTGNAVLAQSRALPQETLPTALAAPPPPIPRDTMDPRIMQVMTDAICASQQARDEEEAAVAPRSAQPQRSASKARKTDTIVGLTDAYADGPDDSNWDGDLQRQPSKASTLNGLTSFPRRILSRKGGPPPASANRQNRNVQSNYSGRVDSKPLRDLEEILDSFGPDSVGAPSIKGDSLPPIPDSAASSARASSSTTSSGMPRRPPPLALSSQPRHPMMTGKPLVDTPSSTHSISPTMSVHPIKRDAAAGETAWELSRHPMSLYSERGDIIGSQSNSPTKSFAALAQAQAQSSRSLSSSRDTSSSSLAVGSGPKPSLPSPPRSGAGGASIAATPARFASRRQPPLKPLVLNGPALPSSSSYAHSTKSPLSLSTTPSSQAHSIPELNQSLVTSGSSSPPTPPREAAPSGNRRLMADHEGGGANDFVPLEHMKVDPYYTSYRSATDSVYALYDDE